MRLGLIAAVALVALFVATRVALLVTSYDANVNWEEPVFLFSGLELVRDGLGHVFDHQDDLNHGGSVALLLTSVSAGGDDSAVRVTPDGTMISQGRVSGPRVIAKQPVVSVGKVTVTRGASGAGPKPSG